MRYTKIKMFILLTFLILLKSFNSYSLAETKHNSIIKLFCLNSFKEEMLKAEIDYSQEIADETCQCYLDEFVQTSSHQNAISKCKIEAQEKFKS